MTPKKQAAPKATAPTSPPEELALPSDIPADQLASDGDAVVEGLPEEAPNEG